MSAVAKSSSGSASVSSGAGSTTPAVSSSRACPGLVVAYLTFNLPFAIWIMYAFFVDLPPILEESAMVDGATRFQAFRMSPCLW